MKALSKIPTSPVSPPEVRVMRLSAVGAGPRRLDSENYLSGGHQLRQRLAESRVQLVNLGNMAAIWQPGRLKGVLVEKGHGLPFLAATQVFDVRPTPRKWLSAARTPEAAQLYVEPRWILVTRSGIVGNAMIAHAPHKGTIISDDLLRIVPKNVGDTGFLYAFLRTSHARSMTGATKYGNVIKHLEPEHLLELPVPMVGGEALRNEIADSIRLCFDWRDRAFSLETEAEQELEKAVGIGTISDAGGSFSVGSKELFVKGRRLDATFHDPRVAAILARFRTAKLRTETLQSVSERVWWMTRFKRVPGDQGAEYMSADDLFTVNPTITKHIMLEQVDKPSDFYVKAGWIAMVCSGQVYGLNGSVALMTKRHERFFMSHDLIRIIPREDAIRPGYLCAVMGHPTLGRPLVLRNSYGTSIPHLEPADVASMPIVRLALKQEISIADKIERASAMRGDADTLENRTVELLEAAIGRALGDVTEDGYDACLARFRLQEEKYDPSRLVSGKKLKAELDELLS